MADTPTIEDRLAALEAEVATLKAAPAPKPVDTSALEAKVNMMQGDVAQAMNFKAGLQKAGIGQGL